MHKNKKKSKAKQTCKFKNCLHLCAYHCAQLLYTIQHITVLIIFPLNLQTVIIALMLSIGGEMVLVLEAKLKIHDVKPLNYN